MKQIRRFTLVEMIIFVCIAVAAFIFIRPIYVQYSRAGNHSRMACVSNLKQLGLALKMYAEDYDRYFPVHSDGTEHNALDLLRQEDYLADYNVYVCRFSGDIRGNPGTPLTQATISYTYMQGMKFVPGTFDSGIMRDRITGEHGRTRPNHKDSTGSVLFVGGNVMTFKGKDSTGADGWASHANTGHKTEWKADMKTGEL